MKYRRWLYPGLLVALLLTSPACFGSAAPTATPKTIIDTADRSAYTALRAFQVAEETAWHTRLPWPTPNAHATINAKVSQAYQLIIDVANAGIALPPGSTLGLADVAAMTQLTGVVADIVALSKAAPATLQQSATTAQVKVAALVTSVQKGTP